MSTTNKKNSPKVRIEQEMTPETRAEKINILVEEDAKTFDAQEEKFLESTVEEIETQPVNEEFVEISSEEELVEEVPTETGAPFDEPGCTCETPCCDEPCVEPCVCSDPSCACEKEEPKEVHFEFQETYFLGTPNTDVEVSIDTLPEPVKAPEPAPKVKKTLAQMTATEINIYHKTGIIPFV